MSTDGRSTAVRQLYRWKMNRWSGKEGRARTRVCSSARPGSNRWTRRTCGCWADWPTSTRTRWWGFSRTTSWRALSTPNSLMTPDGMSTFCTKSESSTPSPTDQCSVRHNSFTFFALFHFLFNVHYFFNNWSDLTPLCYILPQQPYYLNGNDKDFYFDSLR